MIGEKVLRKQADKLADMLGFPPNTHFEISELEMIENAGIRADIEFRGKTITVTPSMRAAAHIILFKLNNMS